MNQIVVSEIRCPNNRNKNECKEEYFLASETFADCWTEKQYRYFISENSWVEVKDKMFGCRVCREVSEVGMGTQKGVGVNFTNEWVEYSSNCDNRSKEQSSLRKNPYTQNFCFSACESVKAERKKVLLATAVDNMNAPGQVFSEYISFPCQSSFHELLHNHPHLSVVCTVGQKRPQYQGLSPTPPITKKKAPSE
jgi:hypothetical protein